MEKIIDDLGLMKSGLERLLELEKVLKNYEYLEKKIGMSLFEFVDLHFKEERKEETLGGKEVSQETIDDIKTYFTITKHAIGRLEERTKMVVRFEGGAINYNETVKNIKYKINHRILAYYNTDGTINIAINKYNYFVFSKNEENNHWVLVTFKEKSYNENDIFYKRRLAEIGYDRKESE